MRLSPGSFLWLVANDLRLAWRGVAGMLGGLGPRTVIAIAVVAVVALHLAGWLAVRLLSPLLFGSGSAAPLLAILGAVLAWMIAQSLFAATRTLYDRGDLDLLLGSPLSPRKVIAAKAVGIAASTLGSLAFLVVPVAHMGAIVDRPTWLAVIPSLVAFALLAVALALGLLVALVSRLGPRRARTWAQLTGAGIGGLFVLGAQIVAMLPESLRASVTGLVEQVATLEGGSVGPVALAIAAVRGDIAALILMAVLAVLAFALAVQALGERFAEASLAAAGAPSARARQKGGPAVPRFRPGQARNLRLKEWRLLTRDPNLAAQLSLQIVYTIPIAVVLLRSDVVSAALGLVPTLVVIAAQVAGSVAWVTVSGEDAPELVASAPIAPAAVDRAKLGAVGLPLLAVLALPLAGLALLSLQAAAVAFVCCALAATSTSLLNFWHPMPGNRRGMLRRHSQSKLVALVEHALAMLWAFASVFAMVGTVLAIVPVGVVVAILAFARSRRPGVSLRPVSRLAQVQVATAAG